MLSGTTQHRALPQHESEEIKTLNISFPRMRIERKTCRVASTTTILLLQLTSIQIFENKHVIKIENQFRKAI